MKHTLTERNALWVAAVTSLTWGLTGVFVRLLPAMSPVTITALRLLIALAAVLPFLLFRHKTRQRMRSVLGYPVSYALALLLSGYYLLATTAFQMAPVAEVALLLSTPPLFVLLIRRIRGESSSNAEITGAFLAVTGIAVILVPGISFADDASSQRFYGDILAICAAALTAIYAYTYRVLSEKYRAPDSAALSLVTFATGGLGLSCVAAAFKPLTLGIPNLDGHIILLFLGLGVLSTAVPSLGFAIASKHLPAIITAMISLFIPLFSAIFAYWILEERLSPLFLAGSVLVIWGVIMIIRNRRNGIRRTS